MLSSSSSIIAAAQQTAALGILTWIVIIVFSIAFAVVSYYLYCVPQERLAKKVGLPSTWMAYLPVARNIQRMKLVNMSMWKLMFVGSTFTFGICELLVGVISWMFLSMTQQPVFTYCMWFILSIGYVVMYIIFTYEYNLRLCRKFGYDMPMALVLMFTQFAPVFIYAMAFSDRIQPVGAKSKKLADNGYTGVSAAVASEAGLEGVTGMYMGQKFKMRDGEKFVIGRDGSMCHIVISANSEKVSRKHCAIRYVAAENCYEVTDYSLNGTILENGSHLPKEQPSKVRRGTEILIGDKNNQFKLL